MGSPERLYFITRDDLSEGRRCAMVAHAMDLWAEAHGPQRGTVIIYAVEDERALLAAERRLPLGCRYVLFREPDLGLEAAALATDAGPFRLPLLGSRPTASVAQR